MQKKSNKRLENLNTTNPVPCLLVSNKPELKKAKLKSNKELQDIAPTILKLLGIKKPKEMKETSLF